MNESALIISLFIFSFVVLILCLIFYKSILRFSKNLGQRDYNATQVRWAATKPSLGGIVFYAAFILSVFVYIGLFAQEQNFFDLKIIGIIIAASLGFFMGFLDDAYNTKPLLKFSVQILSGIVLVLTGTYIQLFSSMPLNYFVTVFWVVAIMNSINMLDNMDMISTIVSLFVFATALVHTIITNSYASFEAIIILGVFISLVAYIPYNWNPSKMYMGDSGSQFLGVLLALVGIIFFWNADGDPKNYIDSKQLIIVLTVFGLTIIDTTTVSIKRLLRGKSPFVGGRDHTTHHLSYIGLSDRKIAWLFIILSIINSLAAIIMLDLVKTWSILHSISFFLIFIIEFVSLFYIANKNLDKN